MRGRVIGLTLVGFTALALSLRAEPASAQSRTETLRYVTGATVNTLDPNVPRFDPRGVCRESVHL